jgi:hypothetical protein
MEAKPEESEPGFLGGVTSYRRLMHAHTKSQLDFPSTGTLPAYTKTMHAFTMNQLQDHRQGSKSETSSPHIGPRIAIMPSKMRSELTKLSLDEVPHGPRNTPERGVLEDKIECVMGIEVLDGRRRSLTEPNAMRDFAAVRARELSNAGAVAV